MSRILLADDSPHAQRMGERILRDEGYEVVSVTDGETAAVRLADVDPDVIVADVFLPGKSGVDLCRYVKAHPSHKHARIILTAGLLETFDEAEASSAGADAIIKKPFEASAVLDTVKALVEKAQQERNAAPLEVGEDSLVAIPAPPAAPPVVPATPVAEGVPAVKPDAVPPEPLAPKTTPQVPAGPAPEIPTLAKPTPALALTEEERVRAAVVVALDAAFPSLVDEITARVLDSRKN
jgi:CheY-like chemotaxis protein